MKYAFWGVGIIAAGLIGIVFIAMFQSFTINDETEYYVIKEAMEASMLESIDLACYADSNVEGCGEVIKISEQKFVENFTRRFTENITGDVNSYELEFYDIIESPPKASIIVKGISRKYSVITDDKSFNILNHLSGIIEYDPNISNNNGGIVISLDDDEDMNINNELVTNTTEIEKHNPTGTCEDCEGDYLANKELTAEERLNYETQEELNKINTSGTEEANQEIPENFEEEDIES